LPPSTDAGEGAEGLARVLLRHAGWSTLVPKLVAKYQGQGGIKGTVPVTWEEADALDRIGVAHHAKSVTLRDVDAAFQRTKYGVGFLDTLAAYRGDRVRTNAEIAADRATSWRDARDGLSPTPAGRAWVEADESYLRLLWSATPAAMADVQTTLRALATLPAPDDAVPLPVFATRVTGDPHAFDTDRQAGRLLERALGWRAAGVGCPRVAAHAEEREGWLAATGLTPDEISSDVTAIGLTGSHPVVDAALYARTVVTYPLLTLAELGPVWSAGGIAYVVENPAVFVALVRAVGGYGPLPTIVCTSGRPSLAAQRLLAALVATGTTLWYSGDFDADGLSMLSALRGKHGARVVPWRMTVDDYQQAVAALLTPHSIAPNELAPHRLDYPALCDAMLRGGAAYQEALSPQLAADVMGVPAPG
jgi:uncharacterized protein (TIGR02679 family)